MFEEEDEMDREDCGNNFEVSFLKFVQILKDHSGVLAKSQTPHARKEKNDGLQEICQNYLVQFGKEITESQVLKKVNNMKARMKKQTDINQTGNKKIILKNWKKCMLELMQGDSNPTIKKIPGSLAVGVNASSSHEALDENVEQHILKSNEQSFPKKSKVNFNFEFEDEETKELSIAELQRLVLLEQLQGLRLKKEKLLREVSMSRDQSENSCPKYLKL